MPFSTRNTKSKLLKRHIEYYYFHSSIKNNESEKIIFYPNIINALTIYHGSKLDFGSNWSITKATNKDSFNAYYSGLNKEFKISEMEGPFNKLGVAFKPLGINSFIVKPLETLISKKQNKKFTYFDKSFKDILPEVFGTNDLNKKVDLLDNFFLSKLNHFENVLLQSALKLIEKSNTKYKVSELSELCNTTQKTLNRNFKKHLNCNTKVYLDIAQFRKSFNHYSNHNEKYKLIDLTHEFDYYDQAALTKLFKKITGVNPKELFKNTQKFGDENLFWTKKL
jgi:AraC-like DNA-binding protein